MKKVRITLKPESSGKKLYLFPTAEALYLWLCSLESGEAIQVPGIEELVLEPSGFIEAELRGFEYSYEEGGKFRRLELIRMGKAEQPHNAAGLLVTTHSGWVAGGLLPMKDYSDSDIDVRIIDQADAKLDLTTLFDDDVIEEESAVLIEDDDEDTGDPPPDEEDDE